MNETRQEPAAKPAPSAAKPAPPPPAPLYLVGSSPHVHAPGDVSTIMRDVLIALLPAAIAGVVFFGLRALVLMAVCCASCALGEYLCRRAMARENTIPDLSALVTGLLLAFNLPPDLPIWMAVLGSLFAIVVAKQVFGGLGYNPFNPALAGRAFLLIAFTGAMTTWSGSDWLSSVRDAATSATPHTLALFDGATTATPLGFAKGVLKGGHAVPIAMTPALAWRFFLGDMNGCVGETSTLALLIGGLYLLVRKVITWHIPVAFIATAALYAAILHAVAPEASMPASFHLLTGGLFLGALFMATDMVTSPTTPKGKIIFGIGCGLLAMVIRTVKTGAYPEGVSFAILIMNSFVPLINRATPSRIFGRDPKKAA